MHPFSLALHDISASFLSAMCCVHKNSTNEILYLCLYLHLYLYLCLCPCLYCIEHICQQRYIIPPQPSFGNCQPCFFHLSPLHQHQLCIDKPARLIVRLLFGSASDLTNSTNLQTVRRQCCLDSVTGRGCYWAGGSYQLQDTDTRFHDNSISNLCLGLRVQWLESRVASLKIQRDRIFWKCHWWCHKVQRMIAQCW